MSVFRVSRDSKKWKYIFEVNKTKYYGGGFSTKADANSAMAEHKKFIKAQSLCINQHEEVSSLDEFKEKYQGLYNDPQVTIATIFDKIMEDIDLPIRFKNIKDAAKNIKKSKKSQVSSTLRMKILQRDGFACRFCGRKAPDVKLHIDHIIPISLGGITEERNLQTLCFDCNMGKKDKPIIINMN